MVQTRRYKENGKSKLKLVGDHVELISDFDDHGYLDGHGGEDNDRGDEGEFDGVRFTTVFQDIVQALSGSDHHLQFLLIVMSWPNNLSDALCSFRCCDSAPQEQLAQFHMSNERGTK
jgi:hypothetical protein